MSVVGLLSLGNRFFLELSDVKTRAYFEAQLLKAPQVKDPRSLLLGDALFEPHAKQALLTFLNSHSCLWKKIDDSNIDLALLLIRISLHVLGICPRQKEHDPFSAELQKFASGSLLHLCQRYLEHLSPLSQKKIFLHDTLFQSVQLMRNDYDPLTVIESWIRHLQNIITDNGDLEEMAYLQHLVEQRILPKISSLCMEETTLVPELSEKMLQTKAQTFQLKGLVIEMFDYEGRTATINLANGNIFTYEGFPAVNFPIENLYRKRDFRDLFDRNEADYSCTMDLAYLSIRDKRGNYRISIKGCDFLIEKELEPNVWGKYLDKKLVLNTFNVKIGESVEDSRSSVPLGIALRCHAWEKEGSIYFSDPKSGVIQYYETTSESVKKTLVTTLGDHAVHCCNQDSLVRDIEPAILTHVEELEEGRKRLCFPRFNSLSFSFEDEVWRLEREPSYFLVVDKQSSDIEHFNHYLHIKSDSGDNFALIPDREFQKQIDGTQALNLFDINEFDRDSPLAPIVTFGKIKTHLIPLVEGQLQPSSLEDHLFCAYLYFGIRKYLKALEHLNHISQHHLRNSLKLRGELFKLVSFATRNSQAPEGLAVAMRALYLLSRSDPSGDIEPLTSLYNNYLQNLGNIPNAFGYRLTKQEELWIIFYIAKNPLLRTDDPILTRQRLLLEKEEMFPLSFYYNTCASDIVVSLPDMFPWKTYYDNWKYSASIPFSLLSFNRLKTLLLSPANFGMLYDMSMTAKKEPEHREHFEKVLKTIIALVPKVQQEAAFLYGVLMSTNFSHPLGSPNEVHGKRYSGNNEVIAWTNRVKREHGLVGSSITLKIHEPYEAKRIVPKKAAHLCEVLPTHPLYQPRKPGFSLSEARLVFRMKDIRPAICREILEETKAFVLAPLSIQAQYPKEDNYFPDARVFYNPTEACTKWSNVEQANESAFLEAYQLTVEKRKALRLPLLDQVDIQAHLAKVIRTKEIQTTELRMLEKELLMLANFCPEEHAFKGAIQLTGELSSSLSTVDLQYLFFSGQIDAYRQANPYLEDDQIIQLYHLSAQFFQWSIEANQLSTLHAKLTEIDEELTHLNFQKTSECFTAAGVPHSPTMYSLLQQLRETVLQTSQYDIGIQPERLVFEYAMQVMLRKEPDQEKALRFLLEKILAGKNAVAQVRMGGGKTSVFMTYLLALLALGKDTIPVLMTPSFQLKALEQTISEKLKNAFNIDLIVLELCRDDLTPEKLESLLETLEEIQKGPEHLSPKVLMMCPVTLQLLGSEFISTLEDLTNIQDSLLSGSPTGTGDEEEQHLEQTMHKLHTLSRILHKFRESSMTFCDEVHESLNTMLELNLPKGERVEAPKEQVALVAHLATVLSSPFFLEKLHLHTNRQVKEFNRDYYNTKISPMIAQEMSKYDALCLDDAMTESLVNYISGNMPPEAEELLIAESRDIPAKLQSDYEFMHYLYGLRGSEKPEENRAADLIALTKYLLSSLLPYALENKTAGIGFGRVYQEGKPGKVGPWKCAGTPSTNEFGSIHEFLLFSMLTAIITGIEDDQIRAYFETFKKDAQFATDHLGLDYSNTAAVKNCQHQFGISPCELEANLPMVRERLNQDPILRILVEETICGSYARSSEKRLCADAMTTVSLTKPGGFIGVSGTPRKGLLPLSLQQNVLEDPTVNPDVIHILLSKQEEVTIVMDDTPQAMIHSALQDKTTFGILDIGSCCKDLSNENVARQILEEVPDTRAKAVVFFTRHNGSLTSDYPAVLIRGETTPKILSSLDPKELEKHGINKTNYILFLDKRHCEGIDVVADMNARFAVLWGINITLNEGTQGCMRARMLANSQTIKFYLTTTEAALYPKKGSQSFNELSVRDKYIVLVKQMLKMQSRSTAKLKTKAFRKMLSNSVAEVLRDHLVTMCRTKESPSDIADFMRKASSFFFVKDISDPFQSFGSLEKEIPTLETLKSEQEWLFKQLEEKTLPAKMLKAVEAEHKKILALAEKDQDQFEKTTKKPVTQLLEITDGTGAEVECVVEQEIEVQEEIEREVQQEVEEELSTLQSWNDGKEKTPEPFIPEQFIKDHLENPDLKTKCVSMTEAFSTDTNYRKRLYCPSAHKREYGKIFSNNLLVTTDLLTPYTHKISPFDRLFPPINTMVIFKDPSCELFRGVFVSRHQAREIKAFLSTTKQDNVWLIHPGGEIQAGNMETFPGSNKTIQEMMIEFSVLSGNLNLCFKKLPLYLSWLQNSADIAQEDKTRFVEMQYLKYKSLYTQFHLILTNPQEVEQLLKREDESYLVKKASLITPAEISSWRQTNKSLIQYLTSPKQIEALNDDLLMHVTYKQMHLIQPAERVLLITSPRCIRAIPPEILHKLKLENMPNRFLDALSGKQLGYMEDPALFDRLQKERWKVVNPILMAQGTFSKEDHKHFTPVQLAHMKTPAVKELMLNHSAVYRRADHEYPFDDIDDPEVLMLLLEKTGLLSQKEKYQLLTDPKCVDYIEDPNDICTCLTKELLTEVIKEQVETTDENKNKPLIEKLGFVSPYQHGVRNLSFDLLIECGFRDFSALDQVREFREERHIGLVPKKLSHHVHPSYAHLLRADQYSDDAIRTFTQELSIVTLLCFTVDQLKVCLEEREKNPDAYQASSKNRYNTTLDLQFHMKLLEAGYTDTDPTMFQEFYEEKHLVLLSNEQLKNLSKNQLEHIYTYMPNLSLKLKSLMAEITDPVELLWFKENGYSQFFTSEQCASPVQPKPRQVRDSTCSETNSKTKAPKPRTATPKKATAKIRSLVDPEKISKIPAQLASFVNPKLAKHLNREAITGIKEKKVFQALNTSQMRHMRTEQLQMATYVQIVAYAIMTYIDTIISLILIVPVEISYLLTRICGLTFLKGAHHYTTGSLMRMLSLNWYFVRQVVLCGMCCSSSEAAKE